MARTEKFSLDWKWSPFGAETGRGKWAFRGLRLHVASGISTVPQLGYAEQHVDDNRLRKKYELRPYWRAPSRRAARLSDDHERFPLATGARVILFIDHSNGRRPFSNR